MGKLNPVSAEERRAAADKLERDKTLAFLRNPDLWPLWPRLPLKRVTANNDREIATLLSQDEHSLPIKVWKVSLYDRIHFRTTPAYEYASFEEMLDEGKWRID